MIDVDSPIEVHEGEPLRRIRVEERINVVAR